MLKDERMKCICSLVTDGGAVCDVGTDHAFVPIELLRNGRINRAVITDISCPSLEKGLNNVAKNGFSDFVKGVCCDGTSGVELAGISDVIIAGMGGELIMSIIDSDARLKDEGIQLILQPMSRAEELRKYLFTHGFETKPELRVRSDGRLYTIISARFTGKTTPCSSKTLYLGVGECQSELDKEYAERVIKALRIKQNGLLEGGRSDDSKALETLISEIWGKQNKKADF